MNVFYVDGATKNNGKIGSQRSYICVTDGDGNVITDHHIGDRTNNQTEVLALLSALKRIDFDNIKDATIYSDSQLIVNGVTGKWNITAPQLFLYIRKARELVAKTGATIIWIPRNGNKAGIYLERKYEKGWQEYWSRPQKEYDSYLSGELQLSLKEWTRYLNRQENLDKIDEYRVMVWWLKKAYKLGEIGMVHEVLKNMDETLKFIRSIPMKKYFSS